MPPTKPLYVRLPTADAETLDAAAASTGKSKRQLVSEAVRGHLAVNDELAVGRIALREVTPAVLTLDEAAALLKLEPADIEASVERGELPGRRISGEWRFSREALLAWLAGP